MSEKKKQTPQAVAVGGGPRGPRAMGPRQPIKKETVFRVMGYLKP